MIGTGRVRSPARRSRQTSRPSTPGSIRSSSTRSGNWVWAYGLIANLKPGHQETWVDYSADRAPLLFIAGGRDHIMPAAVNRSNFKHYRKSPAVTEFFEFEDRDHWTCGAPGWEAVADHALDWALQHATPLSDEAVSGS